LGKQMTDIPDVGISVRVVPDGLDHASQKLKLSLILRPVPGGTTVHLRSWPSDIEAVLQAAMRPSASSPSVVIQLGIDGSATPLPNIVLTGDTLQSALKSSPSSPNATNLWQRIFTYPDADQIEDLRTVLSTPNSPPPGIPSDAPVVASRHAVLATALEQLRARHTASHLAILELLNTNPNEAKTLRLSYRTEREVSLDYLKSKAFALFGTFQPATSLDQINPTATAMEGIKPGPGLDPDHPPPWYHGPTTLQWRQEAQKAAIAARLLRTTNQNGLTTRGGGDIGNTIHGALENIRTLLNGDAQKLEIFSAFSRGAATPLADESIYLQYGAEHALSNLPDKKFPPFSTSSLDSARRKFFGITQRPSLATFLGLILDFELPLAQFPQPSGTTPITGTISAWIGDPSSQPVPLVPTAFKLSMLVADSTPPTHDYFGPISKYAQTDNLTSPGQVHVDDGMVNLNVATRDNAAYRYVMLSCDAQAGAISTEGSASAALSQDRQGIAQDQITTKLQTLRTRGIAIIDMLHAESTSRDLQNLAAAGDNPPSTLYAEDLLMGYRLDVGIYEGNNNTPVWRSTAERAVAYDDPLMVMPAGRSWTGPFPERDDAFFRPLARVAQQDTPVGNQPQVVAYETVVTWRGTSLAFPTPKDDPPQNTLHKPDDDLAVDSVISPVWPNSSGTGRQSFGLPALRFLDRIATSLRCVWLNGGGLSLDEANLRRQDPSILCLERDLHQITIRPVPPLAAIPPAPKGFKFRRYEEAPAPTWHLHAEDRVTRSSTKELANLPGDQIDRLVLRAPVNSQWGRPRRWLLPAHVSFDLSELHGVFDKAPELENKPSGAFKNVKRDAKGLPEAVDGAVVLPENVHDQTHSRGTVLVSGAPTKDAQPYYPDPLAETLYAAFRRGDTTPGGYRNISTSCDFNPRALWPKNATPVLIELVPIGDSAAHYRGAISVTGGGTDQGRSLASAPKITVELAPGEEVDLLLWCAPASAAALAEHWVIPSASAFAKAAFTGAPQPFQKAMSVMSDAIDRGLNGDHGAPKILTSGSPTPNLSATRRLRLVYPVEKPLREPAFKSPLDFRMIRVIDSVIRGQPPTTPQQVNPDPVQHLKDVWQNYIESMGTNLPSTWPSEAAATRAFFVGTLLIEKASTSSVLCHARWFDFVDDATTIKKVDGKFTFSTPRDDTLPWRSPPLFTIANSSVEPGGGASTLDLLEDDTGALRALNFDFGDTKARRLTLQLVAHSRFDKYFSGSNAASASGVGRFDRASVPLEIWLDSTAKPAPPVLLPTAEALPVFSFTTKPLKNGFIIERVCSIQLKMPIPSWWSSGEDERLALVFPDGLFGATVREERNSVSALERTDPDTVFVSPAGDYLTRRGHDPIRQSGHLGPFITKEDLIDKSGLAKGEPVRYVDGLSMTVAPDDSGGLFPPVPNAPPPPSPPITMSVSIAAYKPTVDEATGTTWNCLVRIDPGQSFWPFVRLSLARYQRHAMPGMELSAPVVTWAKIGPRRTASVEFIEADKKLTLTVEGQGFHLANPSPVLFTRQHPEVDRPYLNVRLVRAARGSQTGQTSWLPVIQNGQKVEWLEVRADYDFEGYVRWIKSIQLPKPRAEEHYGIIVEEYFKMPSDQLTGEYKDQASILVDGHVLFAAVLDLSAEAAYALPNDTRH
jgi:hypothetical protein